MLVTNFCVCNTTFPTQLVIITVVRFTELQGSLSQHLQLDTLTGAVMLRDHNGTSGFTFDRETSDSHYVTVEAKDDGGQGNTNTVELVLR